jgi:succinate dehydrogenase / fumarate reductase, membrane anchor subunit
MVGSVTNFSSNGLSDWLLQRVSAVIVLCYLAFTLFCISAHGFNFSSWSALQHHPLMRMFNALFLISILSHAWIGMWTVFTDYAKPACLRLTLQIVMAVFLFVCLVWGLCLIF